jgi:hypothetical protein
MIRASNAAANATAKTAQEKPMTNKAEKSPNHHDKQTGQFTNVISICFPVFAAIFRNHANMYSDETINAAETAEIVQIMYVNQSMFISFCCSCVLFLHFVCQ